MERKPGDGVQALGANNLVPCEMSKDSKAFLTTTQAAKRAKVTRQAIQLAVGRGDFTEHRFGNRLAIDPAELADWIANPSRHRLATRRNPTRA